MGKGCEATESRFSSYWDFNADSSHVYLLLCLLSYDGGGHVSTNSNGVICAYRLCYVIRMHICSTNIQAQTTSVELSGYGHRFHAVNTERNVHSLRSALKPLGKKLGPPATSHPLPTALFIFGLLRSHSFMQGSSARELPAIFNLYSKS